jgi:predicted component of type VI protein secretion system
MMQGNDSFRLIVRRGPQPNQAYDLNKDIVTLGRDITNDITINDPEVSRHHMRLTRGAGGFTVEDLGSTNGTFVNGQRLTGARPLRNGDMIGLGETVTLAYEGVAVSAAGYTDDPMSAATSPNTPAAPAAQRYAPPQQQAPQQPAGYGAQPGYGAQQPAPYGQPQQPEYSPPAPSGDFGSPYGAPAVPPQPAGYDYDPYEMREEEPRNTTRWILIGCVGASFLCCCGTIFSAFLIDQACLWDRIPVIYDVIQAFGYTMVCP